MPPLSQLNGLKMPPRAQGGAPLAGSQEALAQLLELSAIEPERDAIKNQLEQAQALRRGTKHAPAIGWGAGLAQSLGDVAESAAGAFKERGLREQEAQLGRREVSGRKAFAGIPAAQELLLRAFMPPGPEGF